MRPFLFCLALFCSVLPSFSQSGGEQPKSDQGKVILRKLDLNELDPNSEVRLSEDSQSNDHAALVDAGKGPAGPCAVVHFSPIPVSESGQVAHYRLEIPNAADTSGGDPALKPQMMVHACSSVKGLKMSVEVVDSEDHHLLSRDQEVPSVWTQLAFPLTDFYGWYGDGADGTVKWPIKAILIRFEVLKENAKSKDFETLSIQSLRLEQMKPGA